MSADDKELSDSLCYNFGFPHTPITKEFFKVAKKKPAKTTSKKLPGKIKSINYIISKASTAPASDVCTEEQAVKKATELLAGNPGEHTILIYRLIKKVTTSQETKVQEIS